MFSVTCIGFCLDITAGDNWFYYGAPHYNPGSGIGSLDVTNLDVFLRSGF